MDEKRRKWGGRWLAGLALVIGTVLLVSILGATVFKARQPVITVNSMELQQFDVSFHGKVKLNVSLVVSISVYNPNKVGLQYSESSAYLNYRGKIVGQAPIPAGQISAGQTVGMKLKLTLIGDRLLSKSQALISDVVDAGSLPLTTNTRLSGKVSVLFVNVHVDSYSSCYLKISVSSQSISNSHCIFNIRLS